MVTAMLLPTGRVGSEAYISVPHIELPLLEYEGMFGMVACDAKYWEGVILDFAGIAASFITDDLLIKNICGHDYNHGMKAIRKYASEKRIKAVCDIRHELYYQAFQIVAANMEIIDLTTTAMLLDARYDGWLDTNQINHIEELVQDAMNSRGFHRDVLFPIPDKVTDYLKKDRSRPSRLVRLKLPLGYNGYPYQLASPRLFSNQSRSGH